MRRAGFTLIELLVVIAIIAVLASILFPVFSRARAKATATACLSNVKQIALATMMYASDYDGQMPPLPANPWFGLQNSGWEDMDIDWMAMLYPYLQNNKEKQVGGKSKTAGVSAYVCPGTIDPSIMTGTDVVGSKPVPAGYYYAMNPLLREYSGVPDNKRPLCSHNLNAVVSPADKYLLGDNPAVTYPGACYVSFMIIHDWQWGGAAVPGPHNDGYNMAYCDGHAKWVGANNDTLFYINKNPGINILPPPESLNPNAPSHWYPGAEVNDQTAPWYTDGSNSW